MSDRIENEGFITLSENIVRLINLAKAQNEKIKEQSKQIAELEASVVELNKLNESLEDELGNIKVAGSLQGQEALTSDAKAYVDEIIADLKASLELIRSIEVVEESKK